MLFPRHRNPDITDHEVDVVHLIHDAIENNNNGYTGGWCGLGALMVVTCLGDNYHIEHTWGHWWAVNTTTRAILDPTADQFGNGYYTNRAESSGEEAAHEEHYPNTKGVDEPGHVNDAYSHAWNTWAKDWCDTFKNAQRRSAA